MHTLTSNDAATLTLNDRQHHDTGVFAYNMISRGGRFGLRIVGSLKSQPALNVLAIYEK